MVENVLFVPSIPELAWVGELCPEASPAELHVAGRRLIDYSLEGARRFGAKFVEVLDWNFSPTLASALGDKMRRGYPIAYLRGDGPMPRGLAALEGVPGPLTRRIDDGLVVVWGLGLTMHAPEDSLREEPVTDAEAEDTPAGIYRRTGGRWARVVPHGLVVRNVKAWHSLNMAILRHPQLWTLPGYNSEDRVHLGRNVVIEHGAVIDKPVLVCDNVWIARNVRMEGNVSVASGSYVGEGTRLKDTVVCPDTWIGRGLDFEGKIICGSRVIDAATGTWTDVSDAGVAMSSADRPRPLRAVWRFLRGASYGRRG